MDKQTKEMIRDIVKTITEKHYGIMNYNLEKRQIEIETNEGIFSLNELFFKDLQERILGDMK